MKFHNQRSFMGHEISNVNNKPLLHKKGKQWIVVAISALILAGFGGMVSTTTHADTTATQPNMTRVATKPANNSGDASNVMKQAQGMHKVLTNNAAVQKPSAPSSAVAKKTAPASATSTTSAKSNSVSVSSSVSSKASSSVNSASAKSNSNSSNNKATKPAVHMMLMSSPTPATKTGKWGTANWTLDGNGNLTLTNGIIQDGALPTDLPTSDIKSITTYKSYPVTYYLEGNMGQFANAYEKTTAQADTNGTGFGSSAHFNNLESIDFSGMNFEHNPGASDHQLFNPLTNGGGGGIDYPSMKAMFAGDTNLSTVKDLHVDSDTHLVDMSGMFADCPKLQNLDLSQIHTPYLAFIGNIFHGDTNLKSVDMSNIDTSDTTNKSSSNPNWGFENMFTSDTNLQSINLGPKTILNGDTGIAAKNDWIQVNNNSANLLTSNDVNNGFNASGAWSPTIASGTWGNASWGLDNNGNLVLQGNNSTNGQLSDTRPSTLNSKWSQVKHIYTNNVTAPSSLSGMFSNNANNSYDFPVQSIDLSGMTITSNTTNMHSLFSNDRDLTAIIWPKSMDTSKVNDMGWMFSGDYALTNLKLPSNFNTTDAVHMSDMFDSDINLQTLLLPNNFQNKNNSTDVFGYSGINQMPQLNKLTLSSDTYLGTNANLPSSWVKSGTTAPISASTLESGSGHAGIWLNTIQTDNVYYVLNYSDISSHNNIKLCNVAPNNTSDQYYNSNEYFQPKGSLGTSDAILYDKNDSLTDGHNLHPITELWNENHDYLSNVYQYNLMPGGWNIRTEEGSPNLKFDGGNYYVPIASDNATENIPYNYKGQQVSVASNVNDTSFVADDNIPSGYHADSSNNFSSSVSSGSEQLSVNILPNSANANVEYQYNSSTIASHQFSGNSYQASSASDRSTNITSSNDSGIPAGWTLASNSTNVPFDNSNHTVQLTPSQVTDTINYQYKGTTLASQSFSGNDYRASQAGDNSVDITSSNDSGIPANYHLASASTSFNYDGGVHSVSVVPNEVTNTINYKGNNYSSSAKVLGLYNTPSSILAPSGYHYINDNNGKFTYGPNNTNYTFSIAPNSINIIFKNGNDVILVANDVNTSDSKSNMYTIPLNFVPDGYYLTTTSIQLNNNNGQYTVPVAPKSASANIDYQYNGNTIASTEASGSYGTPSSINSNSFSVAGWHLAGDGTQDFEFNNASGASANGSVDVNVLPNSATDTINYQYNGQTLASQSFSGNYYLASQAGNNSVDVTDNNDSDIPNGYELVNSNNNFSFNNGTYDVAIQPIPQPAPYIPNMPASSVASASSASSESAAPASASNTTSQPSNEIKPIHRSYYSHYRYAKVITPLQLHTSKHFTDKNGVLVIKHPTSFKIMKIVHDHKLTRYEVKYQGHKYFITGNDHFTINNYVQKHDFKSHKHMMVKVITPLIEYRRLHFGKKYVVRNVRKGTILPVKRVITIGKGEMTRFELTNGRYVTSNKLFVKVIK